MGPIEPTPPRLTVVAWPDAIIDARGHRPGSPYVEACWLGTLGPSATWAWQRLARTATNQPGATIDTADLAASLGLGNGLGRNALISRTLTRLTSFGITSRHGDHIAVRLALPDLPIRQLARASASTRAAHHSITGRPLPPPASTILACTAPAARPAPAQAATL